MEDTTRRALLRRAGTALLLTASLPLVACGKKSPPKPPSGDDAPYPRKYPSETAPS